MGKEGSVAAAAVRVNQPLLGAHLGSDVDRLHTRLGQRRPRWRRCLGRGRRPRAAWIIKATKPEWVLTRSSARPQRPCAGCLRSYVPAAAGVGVPAAGVVDAAEGVLGAASCLLAGDGAAPIRLATSSSTSGAAAAGDPPAAPGADWSARKHAGRATRRQRGARSAKSPARFGIGPSPRRSFGRSSCAPRAAA